MSDKNLLTENVPAMSEADRDWIEREMYPANRKKVHESDLVEFQIKNMSHGYDFPDDPGMTDTGMIKKFKLRKV